MGFLSLHVLRGNRTLRQQLLLNLLIAPDVVAQRIDQGDLRLWIFWRLIIKPSLQVHQRCSPYDIMSDVRSHRRSSCTYQVPGNSLCPSVATSCVAKNSPFDIHPESSNVGTANFTNARQSNCLL